MISTLGLPGCIIYEDLRPYILLGLRAVKGTPGFFQEVEAPKAAAALNPRFSDAKVL